MSFLPMVSEQLRPCESETNFRSDYGCHATTKVLLRIQHNDQKKNEKVRAKLNAPLVFGANFVLKYCELHKVISDAGICFTPCKYIFS